jgi:uncharacterized delta-60 repeat protein|tara:strand:- start:263018 stop:264526 length:1509 start_codon:yes stop_codon:yes gene_type:complete
MKTISIFLFFLFSTCIFAQDGSLDTSFGDNGILELNLTSLLGATPINVFNHNIVELPDGSYLFYGSYNINSTSGNSLFIIKVNSSGELVNTFGNNGVVTLDTPSQGLFHSQKIWVKNNQKILLSNHDFISGVDVYYITQLNTDGSLDTSFGTNGRIYPFSGTTLVRAELTIDDKLIVAKGKTIAEGTGLQFKKYLQNGQIDSSFGTNGVSNASFANDALLIRDFKLNENGAMFVASSVQDFNNPDLLLITKHLPNGTLDLSFSDNGIVTSPVLFEYYNRVKLDLFANEGVLITQSQIPGGSNGDTIYKLTASGELSTSFGSGGFLNYSAPLADLFIQENQRILFLAHNYGDPILFPGGPFQIVRFYNNGEPDTSINFETEQTDLYRQYIYFTTDSNGKIVISAVDWNDSSITLFRLLNNPLGNEENKIDSLQIFPNPANNVLQITCNQCNLKGVDYKIVDSTGKVIVTTVFESNNPLIPISSLSDGLYFLHTSGATVRFIKK